MKLKKIPKTSVVIEHDFTPEEKDDEPEDLFKAAEKSLVTKSKVVEIYDNVTYFMVKDNGKKEKRAVQIVPTQAGPDIGTIAKHPAIRRALLGSCEDNVSVNCIDTSSLISNASSDASSRLKSELIGIDDVLAVGAAAKGHDKRRCSTHRLQLPGNGVAKISQAGIGVSIPETSRRNVGAVCIRVDCIRDAVGFTRADSAMAGA